MLSTIALSALLGLASAAPTADIISGPPHHGGPPGPPGPPGHGKPTPSSGNGQQPFKFPLSNGFPNIANPSDALNQIQLQAHGTLPNATLPSSITDQSATVFQLIAFNELFEVAFFTSLLNNITASVPGFDDLGSSAAKNIIINALTAVQAQEELHALGANGILAAAGRDQIQPCQYIFPTSDFDSAIALASTFTDVVLGTLQDALAAFGADGDVAFLPLVGSVIGQEGEQNGFYRLLSPQQKIPSALPFLTRSAAPFALSALLQNFVVPGSCPNLELLTNAIPVFETLTPLNVGNLTLKDQTLTFTLSAAPNATVSLPSSLTSDDFSITYINQQNVPVTVPISNIKASEKEKITFDALFPGQTNFLNGLTISALTKGKGPFKAIEDVVKATVAGPGLIEIN